ncbi:glycerate kinase-like isoform X4 [Babylonia areolata]|uniref:glycerate kinase-like isoform X4 n=1 Tax=Babylonia areolata TaxID=304850 RepID=UPI003FD4F427
MALQTWFHSARQLTRHLKNARGFRGIYSVVFTHNLNHQQPLNRNYVHPTFSPLFGNAKQFRNRGSISYQRERSLKNACVEQLPGNVVAEDIYREAVNSVEPHHMVESVLQFDAETRVLTVEDKTYRVDRNVYVVGFGKAVLGMARAVEDILGEHVVSGIVSIPRGQREILKEKGKGDLLLWSGSQIQVYEGANGHLPDSVAHSAALAIESLLAARTETDLVIFLVSGGGSALLPCPQQGISLDDLITMTATLYNSGVTVSEVNVLRSNVERLKGGKAVDIAHPAKMVSLIISDVVGDTVSLIAGGPTVPNQVTAHQCLEILNRFGVRNSMPASILAFLERQLVDESFSVRFKMADGVFAGGWEEKQNLKERVHNVLVGSNRIACQAAAVRARELGHVAYILTTSMVGEVRSIGATLARLGTFMLLCFDQRHLPHLHILTLEVDLIKAGITKQQINEMVTLVSTAVNTGCDAVIISGGEGVVSMKGAGIGGRNLELAIGAGMELQRLFQLSKPRTPPSITLLSADTDGEDGASPAAGAVVTENLEMEVRAAGLGCEGFLLNNDSHALFEGLQGAGGRHLVVTRMTGTNVMDIQVLIVRNPLRPSK